MSIPPTAAADLTGATGLVTGGGTGIGYAIASALSGAGMTVTIVGRRAAVLEQAVADSDGRLRALAADLTEARDVQRVAEVMSAESTGLDLLVHSAGAYVAAAMRDATLDDLDAQYQANVRAPYALTQALLPYLTSGGGDVVFVNSTSSTGPRPGVGQFAATQSALRSVADSLRGEINDERVRVLSVFPGRTATPRQELIHQREGKPYAAERLMQAQDVAAMILAAVSLPRTAEVTEIVLRPFAKPVA